MSYASTNFSGYTSDVQPSDWTAQWDAGATFLVKDVAGGKVLRVDPSANLSNNEALKWDGKDDDGSTDLIVRLKVASWGTTSGFQLLQQGSGSDTTETAYSLGLYSDGSGTRFFRFLYYLAGSVSALTSEVDVSSIVPSTDSDVFIRFSSYAGVLYGKVWAYGTAEPDTWIFSVTTSVITASGWTGIRAYSAAQTFDVAYFGLEYGRVSAVEQYSTLINRFNLNALETADATSLDLYFVPSVSINATETGDAADFTLVSSIHASITATEIGDAGGVELFVRPPVAVSIIALETRDTSDLDLEHIEHYLYCQQEFTFQSSVEIYGNSLLEVEQVLNFDVTAEMLVTSSLEVVQEIQFAVLAELVGSQEIELGAMVVFVPELSLNMAEQMEVHNLIWFTSYAEMAANSDMEAEVSLYFKPEVVG